MQGHLPCLRLVLLTCPQVITLKCPQFLPHHYTLISLLAYSLFCWGRGMEDCFKSNFTLHSRDLFCLSVEDMSKKIISSKDYISYYENQLLAVLELLTFPLGSSSVRKLLVWLGFLAGVVFACLWGNNAALLV